MRKFCDMHCHLIPGVDDGSSNMDVSLAVLKQEYVDGVRTVILTPHYRRGMFEVDREEIFQKFVNLKQAINEVLPDMKLYLGCEYHVNHEMIDRLKTSDYYRICGSDFVLAEFSESHEERYIRNRINDLIQAGYRPIIAHIERYPACRGNLDLIEELRNAGCLIQVNADSVCGKEGWGIKRFVKKLMKEDLVDMIGSDAHDQKKRAPHLKECAEYLDRTFGIEYTDKVMYDNVISMLDKITIDQLGKKTQETPSNSQGPKNSRRKPVIVEEPVF